MTLRQIALPWSGQPQEAAQLSREWVDRGLQSVWLPGVLLLPGGCRVAGGGSATVGPFGSGAVFNGTNQSIALGRGALSHGRGARIAWMRIGSASGSRNISAGGNAGTGFRINGTTVEIVNTGASVDLAATSAVSAGETCVLGMSAEPFNLRLYKNGVLLTSRIDRGTGNASNNLDTLGQTGTGSQYLDGAVFMHASFSVRLSDEDQAALAQDPWQLFEPLSIWVPSSAAAAPVDLGGAAAAVASANGQLSTQIRMRGAGAAVSSASGALTTSVRLGGTASAAATSTGALSTAIRLAGVAPTVALAAGALSTSIWLSGAAQAQATAWGTIVLSAGLSGAASASASAGGALTTGIRLEGSASATALATGALAAPGAGLAGSAKAGATATGALETEIRLGGNTSAAVAAAGQLLTSIRLAASATCEAMAAGALSSTGDALQGATVAQCIAAGRLTTQILLAARATGSAIATGRLAGDEAGRSYPLAGRTQVFPLVGQQQTYPLAGATQE